MSCAENNQFGFADAALENMRVEYRWLDEREKVLKLGMTAIRKKKEALAIKIFNNHQVSPTTEPNGNPESV